MDSTSVEDFQDYHNRQSAEDIVDTLISTPYTESIDPMEHNLDDDQASLSGSAHHSSGPDEAVFDHPSSTSSPRTSNGSDDEISVLESHYDPDSHKPATSTPLKTRSPFRKPSSIRAMQMDTTPPHLSSPSSQHHHQKLFTPSRQHTPRSTHSRRGLITSPPRPTPSKKLKKEYPLILLHITLLPIPHPYTQEIMDSVLPPSILENWKTLDDKATSTVLERGILIPHPKEDYDLLEERLLESLDLKVPRILKCGHFHLEKEEEEDVLGDEESERDEDDANDADICGDCGRRIRDDSYGSTGTGSKRWDIKLFAANGLMRAGAWSAAWREMERVDVEIVPWMPKDMKRELELRTEEEERAKAEAREDGVGGLDDERLREIYGGEAQAFVDGMVGETEATREMERRQQERGRGDYGDVGEGEKPLLELLQRYLWRMARDRRNVVIFLLSLVVLLLSVGSFSGNRARPIADVSRGTDSASMISQGISSMNSGLPSQSASVSNSIAPEPTISPLPPPAEQENKATSATSQPQQSPQPEPTQETQPQDEEIDILLTESAQEEMGEIIED